MLGQIHQNGITESKTYDAASQLLANTHLNGSTPVTGHGYTLDATGRRTAETFTDGSTATRSYGYDLADQVTSATYGGTLSDSYAYDPAGNRSTATIASLGGSTTTYTANSANQYSTISGMSAPSHDSNGNLTSQNGVTYTWDSENRLLSVTPNVPALGDQALVHIYDGQHRRVIRTLREWTSTGWQDLETLHYVYDGWNVIEESTLISSTATLVRTRTWGSDLSGSMQGAGGVGGLLLTEEIGTSTTAYHFQYDGNGNVTEITDLSGNSAASYRYDAFGNTLVATGSYAASNKYRFSTKPLDGEVTNAPLYYYAYRFYDPVTGRWPSRDPIGENGGINLYCFCMNCGISRIDILGNDDAQDFEITQVSEGVKVTVKGAVDLKVIQNKGRELGAKSLSLARDSISKGSFSGGSYQFSSNFESKIGKLTKAGDSVVFPSGEVAAATIGGLIDAYSYVKWVGGGEAVEFTKLQRALSQLSDFASCIELAMAAQGYIAAIPTPISPILSKFMADAISVNCCEKFPD